MSLHQSSCKLCVLSDGMLCTIHAALQTALYHHGGSWVVSEMLAPQLSFMAGYYDMVRCTTDVRAAVWAAGTFSHST